MVSLRVAALCSALLLGFGSLSSVQLHAGTGTLWGRVVSSHGQPMTGASAYLLPSQKRVDISPDGMYALDGIEDGVYQIAVVHPGYHFYISSPMKVQGIARNGIVLVMRGSDDKATADYDGARSELERVLRQCSAKNITEHKSITKKEETPVAATSTPAEKKDIQPVHPVQKQEASSATGKGTVKPINETVIAPGATADESKDAAGDNHIADELVTEVSVVPNPVSDNATVSFELGKEGSVLLEIFSVATGERLLIKDLGKREKGTNSTELNLSNLPHGSYTALVRASTCQYALTTFIKE